MGWNLERAKNGLQLQYGTNKVMNFVLYNVVIAMIPMAIETLYVLYTNWHVIDKIIILHMHFSWIQFTSSTTEIYHYFVMPSSCVCVGPVGPNSMLVFGSNSLVMCENIFQTNFLAK